MKQTTIDISMIPKDISISKWKKLIEKGYLVYDSTHKDIKHQSINITLNPSLKHIDVSDEYNYLLFKELMDDIDMH